MRALGPYHITSDLDLLARLVAERRLSGHFSNGEMKTKVRSQRAQKRPKVADGRANGIETALGRTRKGGEELGRV